MPAYLFWQRRQRSRHLHQQRFVRQFCVAAQDFGGNVNCIVRNVGISAIGMTTMSQTSSTVMTIYRNKTQVTQNPAVTGQDGTFLSGCIGYFGASAIGNLGRSDGLR